MKWLLGFFVIAIGGVVYVCWVLLGKRVKRDRLEDLIHYDDVPMHTDRLIGRVGQVVSTVTQDSGQIEIKGALWEARLASVVDDIAERKKVRVVAFEGTCLLVSALAE